MHCTNDEQVKQCINPQELHTNVLMIFFYFLRQFNETTFHSKWKRKLFKQRLTDFQNDSKFRFTVDDVVKFYN